MLAGRIGMDPFEFRYINVAREGDTCTTSVPYREYPMRAMMDMLAPRTTGRPWKRPGGKHAGSTGAAWALRGAGITSQKCRIARKSIWS